MAREYDIKRGHWKTIDGDKLPALIEAHFGSVKEDGDGYVSSFGAIDHLRVEMVDKSTLLVDTEMNLKADPDDQMKTIRAWNDFLEQATGFDAKKRGKRAQEKAKKAD